MFVFVASQQLERLSSSKIYKVKRVKFDSSPRPLNIDEIRAQIPYLETASSRGIKGEVNLKVWVDANGNYAGHEAIGNSHPLLKIPCEAYVRMLRFRPATYKGRKIGGTFIFRHSFGKRYTVTS
ncbi:MAG: energy transducer TonB [Bacteroidota bacterium]